MVEGNGKDKGNGHAKTLLEFPCRYEIKAMGREGIRFEALVQGIVCRHIGRDDLLSTGRRLSRNGNYLSLTCIIWATSLDQLELIYADLKSCPEVLLVL